ncbi:MAG TPA: TonB-dependent receptor [Chryseosolibacter sp.]|nr:TonB-dependent receptor [Chryseosolibacter sp.]
MSLRFSWVCYCLLIPCVVLAQTEVAYDTTLQEVIIHAYSIERPLASSPTSVAIVNPESMQRFSSSSILAAVNSVSGVRMEERSPGSYRFAIRGSAIRSPFGVRNVKVYYNGIPFTDAGGNTYLNLLDAEAIGSLEIIKGPGGSMYGAGTGGVLLISSPSINDSRITYSSSIGSFKLARNVLAGNFQSEKVTGGIVFSDHQSDGYRRHAEMERRSIMANLNLRVNEDQLLATTILYSNLFYQTPGGLTRQQFETNPRQARPSGPFPGAVEKQAAVFNNAFVAGITHTGNWSKSIITTTSLYGGLTDFVNPSIREYEERYERNFGFRSVIDKKYKRDKVTTTLSAGTEMQFMDSPVKKYDNDVGEKTTLNSDDSFSSRLLTGFIQGDFNFSEKWIASLGLSANHNHINFSEYYPVVINEEKSFKVMIMPRIAVLRRIGKAGIYTSYSRGYSPPTVADLYPSGGTFNPTLLAEVGNNIEVGVKGNLRKLTYDITAYHFSMRNTIVRRVTHDDLEYFINAGRTNQRGLESTLTWDAYSKPHAFFSRMNMSASYTYNRYRFSDYQLSSGEDVSGNRLTGVPPTMVFGGIDLEFLNAIYLKTSIHYTDHIPLNDLNSVFSEPYSLVTVKAGYQKQLQKTNVNVYAGVDNLLDQRYSLGHDLNAIGGRYYNAAAPINFYFGLRVDYVFRQ